MGFIQNVINKVSFALGLTKPQVVWNLDKGTATPGSGFSPQSTPTTSTQLGGTPQVKSSGGGSSGGSSGGSAPQSQPGEVVIVNPNTGGLQSVSTTQSVNLGGGYASIGGKVIKTGTNQSQLKSKSSSNLGEKNNRTNISTPLSNQSRVPMSYAPEQPQQKKSLFQTIEEEGSKYIGIGTPGLFGVNYNSLFQRASGNKTNEPIFGFSSGKPLITNTQIGNYSAQNLGMPGKVFNVLLPKTPSEVAITAVSFGAYGLLPKAGKIAANVYFSYSGIKGALNTKLPKEERIASGIVSGLAVSGAAFESFSYLKGIKASVSPDYFPVGKQAEGFKAINIKTSDFERLGLIPEKSPLKSGLTSDISLPKISPLKRGGFSVKQTEKGLFLGSNQVVSTSQQGFFKAGKTITLEREFFTTPQEPFIKIPETRISRLGLSDFLKPTKNIKVEFGFPKQPQIGFEAGASVSRTGSGGSYRIGSGSELEAIKSSGEIFNIKKIGITKIKGQGVDIFSFQTGKSLKISDLIRTPNLPSSLGFTRVSGEGLFSSFLGGNTLYKQLTSKKSSSRTPLFNFSSRPVINKRSFPLPTFPSSKSNKPSSPIIPTSSSPLGLPSKPTYMKTNPSFPSMSFNLPKSFFPSSKSFRKQFQFLPFGEKKKSSLKLFPQPKKYQPTLMAAALNIQAPKIPKAYFRGAGAIIQRPLVISMRKKRR